MHRKLWSCWVALLVLAGAEASAHEYKLTLLGTLGGDYYNFGHGINASGQVVGRSQVGQREGIDAALWKGKVAIDLGMYGAYAINDHGVIVGEGGEQSRFHALVWHRGTITDLGTLEGHETSTASGVNRHGHVVGSSWLAGYVGSRGFLWADGVMAELPSLGGLYSHAIAINGRGQIAGSSELASGETTHATLWGPGGGSITDLGTIGGRQGRFSRALAINDAGVAVGFGDSDGGADHAVLWRGGQVIDLGTLGGRNSVAWGINNKGQTVGYSEVPTDKHEKHWRAVLWEGTTAVDLTKRLPGWARQAGWELAVAYAINDDGVITGRASNKVSHADRAFRLEPIQPKSARQP